MALSSRESTQQIRKYYVGLEAFKVIAFNPNANQLKEIYNTEEIKEPEYIGTTTDGVPRARFSFILDNENETNSIKTRVDYYLTKEFTTSQSGKTKVCNAFGQFTWLEDSGIIPENMEWFKNQGVRPCYKGEEELVKFLWARLNIRTDLGDTIQLENVEKYFSGDFSDIRNVLEQNTENKVMFCTGVKKTEGDKGPKYNQVVFAKHTMKPFTSSKTIDAFHKILSESNLNNSYFGTYPYQLTEVIPSNINFENIQIDNPSDLSRTKPVF